MTCCCGLTEPFDVSPATPCALQYSAKHEIDFCKPTLFVSFSVFTKQGDARKDVCFKHRAMYAMLTREEKNASAFCLEALAHPSANDEHPCVQMLFATSRLAYLEKCCSNGMKQC